MSRATSRRPSPVSYTHLDVYKRQSFTFAATANSVSLTGAPPVFADIAADSFCLDPAAVEAAITERTVGVMPVHLYGHPADMPGLHLSLIHI